MVWLMLCLMSHRAEIKVSAGLNFCQEALGKICWELIQVVGRIQFPTVVEMSPSFLAGCQPEAALYS